MSTLAQQLPEAATLKPALEQQLVRMARLVKMGARAPGTLKMQQGHVPWLLGELGDVPLGAIGSRQLDDLVDRGLAAGLDPKTVQKRCSTLRSAFRLARHRGELERLPEFPMWTFAPPGPPKHRWFTSWEEAKRVCDALPPERSDWLVMTLRLGEHASDVERKTWADVRLERGEILVRNTKNRRPGLWVVCPRPLLELLRRRHRERNPAPTDRILKPWPTRGYQLPRACLRVGLLPVTATGARHTATTFAVAELGITVAAQRWFGWSSTRMMESTYAHALPGQLREVADALSGPRRPPRGRNGR
jgi:integrase